MIEVENLQKHYGAVRAVDGITFSVAPGEVFGLLGHNGAGKTTTLRMLTGRTLPTSGSAHIAEFDVVRQLDQVKPLINVVFEDQNLYERLSGLDNLRVFADLYGARPGLLGLIRLLRLTVAHLAVTGGIAATDSLIQQVVGHGVAAKLSARLGEGVLNGLLTARLGLAAIEVSRPLPFTALDPPSVSDLAGDLVTRRKPAEESEGTTG